MKGPGSALKKGYKTTLTGITLGSQNIPFFNDKVEGDKVEGNPSIYGLISNSTMSDLSTKQSFFFEWNQDIELYSLRNSTAQSDILERLEDIVLDRIIPSPLTIGVSIDAPFKLVDIILVSSNISDIQQIDNNKYLHAKRITLKNLIAQ